MIIGLPALEELEDRINMGQNFVKLTIDDKDVQLELKLVIRRAECPRFSMSM